jgi:DNA-binding MarR family transcriptional regulator
MPLLMLRDLPRYDCLLKAAGRYPTLNPSASEAFLHLLRTGDAVFAEEARFLARHNISQGRFTVLMLLNRCAENPSTPADLAAQAGVTRATMTGLIDTLVKDGIVTRAADSTDRRTVLVSLTKAGRKLIEAMLPDYFACVSKIMEPLNAGQRKQLVGLLQQIQAGLAGDSPANASTRRVSVS